MKIASEYLLIAAIIVVVIAVSFSSTKKAAPDSQPFYKFKRLYEKAQLKFTSPPEEKADLLSELLDKRLSELEYIVTGGSSKSGYILETSLRYSTFAGRLTETVLESNLDEKIPEVKDKLEKQRESVQKLVDEYPNKDDEKKFVIDAVNYLTTYIDQLSSGSK